MPEILNTLYVQTPGASLYLEGDTVRVVIPEDDRRRVLPLRRIEGIVVFGNVQVSTPLLTRCMEDGRPVVWMSGGGRFQGRSEGPTRGNVLLRNAQHLAVHDEAMRTGIARACVVGKIHNSRQVVLRGARDNNDAEKPLRTLAGELAESATRAAEATELDVLMGIEGNAARTYFKALALMQRRNLDIPLFAGRIKRPATDPVNALLSFTYGLLRSVVHGAAEQVGLDPYVGFLHGLRPGKPALALDLMEEFRPGLADRFTLTLLNRRQVRAGHFETLPGGAVQLTEEGRKSVLTEWHSWKQKEIPHRLLGRKVPIGLLPSVQARLLARHLRGELPNYLPWTA